VVHVLDGGGGGRPSVEYESFNGPDVTVNITGLVSFFGAMMDLITDAQTPVMNALMPMGEKIRNGLEQPTDAGVFPEGVYAARLLRWRQSDFQHFLTDVLNGIRNIGSAAAVIAEIYQNTDAESAADINDVAFAFADPRAKPPAGFREVTSFAEAARESGANSMLPMSAMGDDSNARMHYLANGVTLYVYPDGSTKLVTTTTRPGVAGYQSDVAVTTTTIYAPGGAVISTTNEEKYRAYGGAEVRRTTTTQGDEHNGTTATTSTVTDASGRVTVTSETTTRVDGKETTTKSDPVTVNPGEHRSTGQRPEDGTVEDAQRRLDTHGEDWFVAEVGRGY